MNTFILHFHLNLFKSLCSIPFIIFCHFYKILCLLAYQCHFHTLEKHSFVTFIRKQHRITSSNVVTLKVSLSRNKWTILLKIHVTICRHSFFDFFFFHFWTLWLEKDRRRIGNIWGKFSVNNKFWLRGRTGNNAFLAWCYAYSSETNFYFTF